jgi:Na+/H+-translocating membrane pyrophosphatase
MASTTILITVALSLLGLAIALFYMKKVNDVPVDMGLEPDQSERLKFIHTAIADGAMAFLKQEYKFMTIFMIGFGILISVAIDDQHTPQYNEGIPLRWRHLRSFRLHRNESGDCGQCTHDSLG